MERNNEMKTHASTKGSDRARERVIRAVKKWYTASYDGPVYEIINAHSALLRAVAVLLAAEKTRLEPPPAVIYRNKAQKA